MKRVYQYLSTEYWWRRATQNGQFSLGGQRYNLGVDNANQDVKITFDADKAEFVVEDAYQVVIKRLTPKGLTITEITGLPPS